MAKKKEAYTPIYPDLWDQAKMDHLAARWIYGVWMKQTDIDPNSESNWGDLAMGFALGAELRPDSAFDFVLYMKHKRVL